MSNYPLSGIKVLDLSRVLAGPWATQLLADLGATVVKVEHPKNGDDTRRWGPPFLDDEEQISAYFACTNRGKKSLRIDFKSLRGQHRLKQLAGECDIIFENFKPDTLKQYGLDYDSLAPSNRALIYCSISAFGQEGPYRDRPGYDPLIQAMSGLMSVTGTPESGPQKVGVAMVDIATGLYSCVAVLAALQERVRSGQGQYIDMALYDVAVATMANQAGNYLASGLSPKLAGNVHPNIAPFQVFHTADLPISIAIGNDHQFKKFCQEIGMPSLAEDNRFSTNPNRVQNRNLLVEYIQSQLMRSSQEVWLQRFNKANVPAAPIYNMQQVFEDPQVKYRAIKQENQLNGVKYSYVKNPINFSRSKINQQNTPPYLGASDGEPEVW